jgi:DNA-directed RNA polymerase specialized sigma24 family protein
VRCAVEEIAVRKLFRVSLTLEVPQKTHAKQETHAVERGDTRPFDEIETPLESYQIRTARRTMVEERGTRAGAQTVESRRDSFGARGLAVVLFAGRTAPGKSARVVGHALSFVEARGDLPKGYLELDDVMDTALARAYDEFSKDPPSENVCRRLLKFALDEIKAEVTKLKKERTSTVPIEKIPITPPQEEVSTLGDEILDFYQPDEHPKVEDIVPDLVVPPPDQVVEIEEMRRCARAALRDLSKDARGALTLRNVLGLRATELAKTLRKTEAEVERLIENARAQLRRKLADSGSVFRELNRRRRAEGSYLHGEPFAKGHFQTFPELVRHKPRTGCYGISGDQARLSSARQEPGVHGDRGTVACPWNRGE